MMKKAVTLLALFFVLLAGISGTPQTCFAAEAGQALKAETGQTAETGGNPDVRDGTYSVEVSLSGGTGRATIVSPAEMTVSDGNAVAKIEWSSPNFDYMVVDGEQYLPVNTEGNSVFEIPVSAFDEPVSVTADTTAMSRPHEIEYTLTFHSDTIKREGNRGIPTAVAVIIVCAVLAGIISYSIVRRTMRKNG